MVGSEHVGDVRIVLSQGQGRLQCAEDPTDLNNCVIIVEFGMQNLEKFQNGDGVCMQSTEDSPVNVFACPSETSKSYATCHLNYLR